MTSIVIEQLKQQFSDDLLYIYLKKEGFEEEVLFPDFLNQISIDRVYSTIEVAEMFGTNDNNLRYQMKIMRKLQYIDNFRAGRNYRFDFKNIYKMYLVVTILNIEGKNTGDIANILYKKVPNSHVIEVSKKRDNNTNKNSEQENLHNNQLLNELEIQILNKQIMMSELQSKLIKDNRNYLQLDQKFNLMLLESELVEKLNESIKKDNKKWFAKHIETYVPTTKSESNEHLREVKDQLDLLHTEIAESEKRLAIEMYDFQHLLEDKKRLLL